MSSELKPVISVSITQALRALLTDRHLYQSVEIFQEPLEKIATKRAEQAADNVARSIGPVTTSPRQAKADTLANYKGEISKEINLPWISRQRSIIEPDTQSEADAIEFDVPDIQLHCSVCKRAGKNFQTVEKTAKSSAVASLARAHGMAHCLVSLVFIS
jgi:hypothetical protein